MENENHTETEKLMAMYRSMLDQFGPRGWWPGKTRFEICTGAILTQNTAWRNVRKAINNLKSARALNIKSVHDMETSQLAELIVPSGYYNIKAKRLKYFVEFVYSESGGSLTRLFSLPVMELREKLLSVNGIGKETADSIILYAAKKPIFVVDAYTRRIGSRHGLFPEDSDYDDMRLYFTARLPEDTALFNEYHALIVGVGNAYCGRKPDCENCPLAPFLPDLD
ncbi:MAG TPA: endonuclease III domain-containing protein [bacterium]|nr:endonuclease III domain-containing protein [bacterium]